MTKLKRLLVATAAVGMLWAMLALGFTLLPGSLAEENQSSLEASGASEEHTDEVVVGDLSVGELPEVPATKPPPTNDMTLTVPSMERVDEAPVTTAPGDDAKALDNGLLHVAGTGHPWEKGANVYLAGHRLGYPNTGSFLIFYDLQNLRKRRRNHTDRLSGARFPLPRIRAARGATGADVRCRTRAWQECGYPSDLHAARLLEEDYRAGLTGKRWVGRLVQQPNAGSSAPSRPPHPREAALEFALQAVISSGPAGESFERLNSWLSPWDWRRDDLVSALRQLHAQGLLELEENPNGGVVRLRVTGALTAYFRPSKETVRASLPCFATPDA